jgi:hypothetical protein
MSNMIDLISYRAELQRKVEAIDLLLGGGSGNGRTISEASAAGRKMSAAGRARIAAAARARWARARGSGPHKRSGATTNEIILNALSGGRDVATRVIKAACVRGGKSGNAVSVAINALRKNGKIRKGSQTGFWKLA